MAETKEVKPKSFRIDDETHDKFKEISASIGGNQQDAFERLIEAYELQQGKLALKEEKVNVDQFEKYLKCLLRIYMANVEDKQNLAETIRTGFEKDLQSKDDIIKDLQAQIKVAKEQKEEATKKADDLENKNFQLENLIEMKDMEYKEKVKEIENLKLDKTENEEQIKKLIYSCDSLTKQLDEKKAEVEKAREQEQQLEELQNKYNNLNDTYNKLQSDFNNQKSNHENIISDMQKQVSEAIEREKEQVKFDYEKKLLALEKKHQQELMEQFKEYQEETKQLKETFFNKKNNNVQQKNKKQQEQDNTNSLFDDLLKNGIHKTDDTTK